MTPGHQSSAELLTDMQTIWTSGRSNPRWVCRKTLAAAPFDAKIPSWRRNQRPASAVARSKRRNFVSPCLPRAL